MKQRIVVPPVDELQPLPPKATERALAEIHEDEEEDIDTSPPVPGDSIELLPIELGLAVNAPIDAAHEMQVLYIIARNITAQLMKSSKPGKPHPQLLGYIRQSTECVEKLYKMTESVQQETSLEKLKIMRAMFEQSPQLSDEFKIRFLKEMHNKAQAKSA